MASLVAGILPRTVARSAIAPVFPVAERRAAPGLAIVPAHGEEFADPSHIDRLAIAEPYRSRDN
jgi:hypothetical protein